MVKLRGSSTSLPWEEVLRRAAQQCTAPRPCRTHGQQRAQNRACAVEPCRSFPLPRSNALEHVNLPRKITSCARRRSPAVRLSKFMRVYSTIPGGSRVRVRIFLPLSYASNSRCWGWLTKRVTPAVSERLPSWRSGRLCSLRRRGNWTRRRGWPPRAGRCSAVAGRRKSLRLPGQMMGQMRRRMRAGFSP